MNRSTRHNLVATAATCLLLGSACTGPATHVHNATGDRVFVDGVAAPDPTLPFRYYGTSRWDAQPADVGGRPDWSRQQGSGPIDLPPPASLWLFPIDLPIEVLRRIVAGREDTSATIVLPKTPPDQLVDAEVPPTGQTELDIRARQARIAR